VKKRQWAPHPHCSIYLDYKTIKDQEVAQVQIPVSNFVEVDVKHAIADVSKDGEEDVQLRGLVHLLAKIFERYHGYF
jgi:hypothetical protein